MFTQFVLAEDKQLTFEVQSYLVEQLEDKLDPEVKLTDVNELQVKTNVGLGLKVKLSVESSSNVSKTPVTWVRLTDAITHDMVKPKSLEQLAEYVNSCVASFSLYDILKSQGDSIHDYWAVGGNSVKQAALSVISVDSEVADYLFKLFPKDTVIALAMGGKYDRPKLLKAFDAKTMSAVFKLLPAEALQKLIPLVVASTTSDRDFKGVDAGELNSKLNTRAQNQLKLGIDKANRPKHERDFDANNDRFIFVGHEKMVPVPGTKHFEKKLEIEHLYRADRFNLDDHNALSMMHMRARSNDAAVYMITLPKGSVKDPHDLPEWLVDLIDEHKVKL